MILCAAFKIKEPDTIICAHRHGNIYEILKACKIDSKKSNITEGFITHKNEFLDRKEALKHAKDCGQLSKTTIDYKIEHSETELYSEDLY